MKKRGIVSSFIIGGMVFLIIVGLLVLLRNYIYYGTFISSPLTPVAGFTQQCLKQSTEDGVFFLRTQGGYIDLPEVISNDPSAYINLGLKVPHWFYNHQDRMPQRYEMEDELTNYVKRNLVLCLDGFSGFSNTFGVSNPEVLEDLESFEVTTSINKHDVTVELEMPIKLKQLAEGKTQRTMKFPKMQTKVETELGDMHKLAMKIMKEVNDENLLEGYVYDMIATSDYLPHEGLEITCDKREWQISDLEEHLKNVIMHNLNYLTFDKTSYEPSGYDYFDKIYHVDLGSENFKQIKVNTIYNPSWPLNLDVTPKHQNTVKPMEYVMSKIFFNCVKIYHHKYSLEFPVIFQLIADENPDDMFFFSTPVYVKRDEPNRNGEVGSWADDIDKIGSEDYCAESTSLSMYSVDNDGNIVVQPSIKENRIAELDVYAYDTTKGFPEGAINGAEISYHCVKFKCDMGATETALSEDGFYVGDPSVLTTKFPECYNGYVIAEHPGYLTERKTMTIDESMDKQTVMMEMRPTKSLFYEVRVVEEVNGVIHERMLFDKEQAFVFIDSSESDLDQSLFYPPGEIEQSTDIVLFEDDFGKDDIETENAPYENITLVIEKGQSYKIETRLFEDDVVTGVSDYNWTPKIGQVYTNNKVVFYVARENTPSMPTDTEGWQKLYEQSQQKSSSHKPKLVYAWELVEEEK
ncbi:hypothetical protein HN695_00325 [Candidatus Woesearchaeota archaeon]|nr:hypothetical protein [Candidatus Woesearchaeota archaeon]MBT5271996.1 hypothetical protein [Candidatus Woesearchaeota archaeon]MBT6041075.1 hypothetical protein [Candidatus Woesearchaeota archaeon]MBT6337087.1 hypothetical protein [Candidatus Woesearchaeota archaeon]MBT7926758.1 hypothetical protein [Candidatus Woesearchaeota archaeon]